jgi:hypothetical protein
MSIEYHAHALDAAISFSSHIERHWRGASDLQRSAETLTLLTFRLSRTLLV